MAREEKSNLLEEIEQLEKIDQLGERSPQEERSLTKILVVDDEQIMRDLLIDVLRTEGYNVCGFSQAKDALRKVGEDEVEIIITNINMKGMNGIELLEKIKKINPKIDVIVMTGYASVQTAIESMKLGAVDYLTKPLNIDHIKIIVNKTANQRFLKKRANEAIFYKKLSRLDSLTELFNHRFFQQLFSIEISRAKREAWPVSLIMLDIDNFKAFNDKNGHPMGDLVLKKLSWLLKQNCRNCDFVARYGGEEFAIIIPDASKEVAKVQATRLRKTVEETKFDHQETPSKGRFTVSMGIAEYPTDAKSREELIEKADQALYQAKSNGKNRVEVYKA